MGGKSSKKAIPSTVSNSKCNCSLYHHHKHCCRNQCFPKIHNVLTFISIPGMHDEDKWLFTESHQNSVKKAISNIKLKIPSDLLSTIFLFLTTSINGYLLHCHGEINNYIENGGSLCPIWSKYFFGENDRISDVKLVALGHGGAGKSALVIRFVTGNFLEEYDPTIEDSYRKCSTINGKKILFDILDTAGQQEFSSMQDRWLREAQISLLCFAINHKNALNECIQTFDQNVRIWDCDTNDHFCRRGVLLIGCKMDLMYSKDYKCNESEREIMKQNYDIAMKLKEIWNIPFIETSALEAINVNSLFTQIVYEYWIQTQTKSVNWNATEHVKLLSNT